MPLSGNPYQEWMKADVDELTIEPRARENIRLDFKADYRLLFSKNNDEKDKARLSVLKDISALANGVGGALIIGVKESSEKGQEGFAEKVVPIPSADSNRLEKALRDLANTHLEARPGALQCKPIKYDERGVVMIVSIPQNTYSLSMITYIDCNQFWVRKGRDNCLMSTAEIQYRFMEMTKIRDSALQELNAIHETLSSPWDETKKELVWFAGVPLSRERDHVPINMNQIRDVVSNSCYYSEYSEPSGQRYSFDQYTPKNKLNPDFPGNR